MYTQEDEARLVTDLLCVLGLSVNPTDNTLLIQETGMPIIFDGKNIKATKSPNKTAYISDRDIKLEPANPKCTKLMSHLFGYFLDEQEKEENIQKVLSFYFDEIKNEDLEKESSYELIVKFYDGSKFITEDYRSKALAYTAGIFGIDGSFPTNNLQKFDIDEDVTTR